MTSRSIVLSTAALLLLSAATPVQFGFSPTAAVAQEVSAEVRAALTGDPAGLEAAQLSDRIRVLRDAIESGALKGPDRKAAQDREPEPLPAPGHHAASRSSQPCQTRGAAPP